MTNEFNLPDMTCGACVRSVTLALQQADPRCDIQIDLPSHRVQVLSTRPRQELEQVLRQAGFEPV